MWYIFENVIFIPTYFILSAAEKNENVPVETGKTKKDISKRQMVVMELLQTEQNYVGILHTIMHVSEKKKKRTGVLVTLFFQSIIVFMLVFVDVFDMLSEHGCLLRLVNL